MAPRTRNQAAGETSSLGKRSHSVLDGPLASNQAQSEEQPSRKKRDSRGDLERRKAKAEEKRAEEDENTSSPDDEERTEEDETPPSTGEKPHQPPSDLPPSEEHSEASDLDFNDWITIPLGIQEEEKVQQPPTTNPEQAPGTQWIAPIAPMAHVRGVQELLRASRFLQDLDSARESVRKADRVTSFGSVDIIAPRPAFELHDSFLDVSEFEDSSSESDEASMTTNLEEEHLDGERPSTTKEHASPESLTCGIGFLLKNPELDEKPNPPNPPAPTNNPTQESNQREPAPSERRTQATRASDTAEIAISSRQPAPAGLPGSELRSMSSAGLHWLAHRVQIELGRRLVGVGGEKYGDSEESVVREEGGESEEEEEEGEEAEGDEDVLFSLLDMID